MERIESLEGEGDTLSFEGGANTRTPLAEGGWSSDEEKGYQPWDEEKGSQAQPGPEVVLMTDREKEREKNENTSQTPHSKPQTINPKP